MMHGAHDAAGRVQNDVEIDHSQCDALVHYSQQHEDIRHKDRSEKLEKIFYPEMDNPESPEVRCGEVLSRICEEPDTIKCGNRKCRKEEEPRHVPDMFGIESAAKSAVQDHNPEQQSYGEENLPDAA